MRVVFTIKTLTHSIGGAERMVSSLADALSEISDITMDMHVLSFDAVNDTPFFRTGPKVMRHCIGASNPAKKTGIFEVPALIWRLRKTILGIKPDIVVAFMHSSFVLTQMALLGTGVRVIFSEHTAPAYYSTRRAEFWLMRLFSLFSKRITIVSRQIGELYPFEMAEKMDVLPNPVISDFLPGDVMGVNHLRKIILSVGRLNKDKEHSILIESFSLLAEKFPDWDLRIIGEGPERLHLELLIESLGLDRRVFLPGTTSDMDSAYKSAQIFVLPSRYESFGLATAEAMSHSLPVVGFSDCTGTRELIVNEENGYLLGDRSPESLAGALEKLISSCDLRCSLGHSGYLKSLKFSMQNVVQEWKAYIIRI